MNQESQYLQNKKRVYHGLAELASAGEDAIGSTLQSIYHPDVHWRGAHPLSEINGIDGVVESVWTPLIHAFPDLERRDLILVGGTYEDNEFVAAMGHYCGTFRRDWLTIRW